MLHLVGILFYYLLYIYATNRVSRSVFYFIKFTEEDSVWLVIKKEVAWVASKIKKKDVGKGTRN